MTNIYLDKATPKDFINVKLGDWIEGVGFVETHFELNFIRSFGKHFQSEWEKVLNELEQWVKLGNCELDKAYPNDRLMKKIKELRQVK